MFKWRYKMNHCRKALQEAYKLYLKRENPVLKEKLIALESAINSNDRTEADRLTRDLESYTQTHYQKSWFLRAFELAFALLFALAVATVIRQMWFELYEIPTGSMRPTFKEQDHLTVSKTQFGINVPLQTDHFYFDPDLVQRTSAVIFSGDGIPLPDTDSTFFGIFPYKKRYVKRLMGKPEDMIFFYGGKLYGKEASGEKIEYENLENLEYIPFIGFEGSVKKLNPQSFLFSYFHQPLARATMGPLGLWKGEIFNGTDWVEDDVSTAKNAHEKISTLSDFFGMGNYGMAQIYTKKELENAGLKSPEEGVLYLVIRHTPHLDFKRNIEEFTRLPLVMTTVLPLQQEDLKTLLQSMYTSRFDVENGKVRRYSLDPQTFSHQAPLLSNVPSGTYEFYYGKAYQVHFGGITTELPETHPLYSLEPSRIQQLYNLGTNWDTHYQPKGKNHGWPNRYVYFRNGDLYTLGSPLLKKDDSRLKAFLEGEMKRAESGFYTAFKDHGPPKEDPHFLQTFGLKIPQKNYLVLGDNHAMSGDSRLFGFVPEANLQGVPEIILWPFGDRMGRPNQTPYPTFVTPRLIVWALALLIGSIAYVIHRRKLRKPLVFNDKASSTRPNSTLRNF